jgi:hypothetical protein
MGAMSKNPRPRTQRREAARAKEKFARDREKLTRLEAGGAPERPIPLESASQVEVHARSLRCARCDAELRVEEHLAPTVGDQRLRLVRLRCDPCGARRDAWFRLEPRLPS